MNSTEFYAGMPVELRVAAKKSLSQNPIAAAAIEVKVISTVEPPRVIFRGKTAADGTAVVRCTSRRSPKGRPPSSFPRRARSGMMR